MRVRSALPVLALLCGLGATACETPEPPQSLAFRDVRVFDGERTIEKATVLVEDGHIAAVGTGIAIPRGARVIEGEQRTLLPGLIDAHAHVHGGRLQPEALAEAGRVLRQSLVFGVTTVMSMGGDPAVVSAYRTGRTDPGSLERADLLAAGWIVAPPGSPYSRGGPTLTRARDADAFVRARVDEGSDHIKIVYQLGSADPRPPNAIPMFEEPVLRAAVEAAHKYGRTVAVHVNSLGAAKDAVRAGAEVLGHVPYDQVADDELIRLVLENGTFVTSTLTVHDNIFNKSEWREADDPRVAPYLGPDEVAKLRAHGHQQRRPQWTNMNQSVRAMHAAGVRMLAGVDLVHLNGPLMHRELETLVSAGLDATAALIAATSAPADAFGLEDRGRIVPGARADLLLVRGDPTTDITVTRDIVGVWKLGIEADRAGYAEEKQAQVRSVESEDELVLADFESGDLVLSFGRLGQDVTFGTDGTVEMSIEDDGAVGSGHALAVSGRITKVNQEFVEAPWWYGAYAGVSFSPAPWGEGLMDFSARSQISFWARGDSAIHRLLLFTGSRESPPIANDFEVGPEWTEFTFPFSSFEGADLSAFWKVFLAAGPEPGDFRFEIDEIRLR